MSIKRPVVLMVLYDLSIPIKHGTDWYNEPGTKPVSLEQVGSYEEGWVSHQLSLMVLNGCTYLETAAHLYPDMPTLDQIPPEKFVLRAHVVALNGTAQELPAPASRLRDFQAEQDAILLHCGWDSHVDSPDYYHASPYFSPGLQQWLLDHRPAVLGGDMLSYDHPQNTAMPFLHEFFRGGGMILCPLLGLAALPPVVVLYCAPLKLVGSSAALCRVFASD